MAASFLTFYIYLSFIMASIILLVGLFAYQNGFPSGKKLAAVCFFAALVDISYLYSIACSRYLVVSIFSSIYFIGIDWMLYELIRFCEVYTDRPPKKREQYTNLFLKGMCYFETVIYAINPFQEIAISYTPRDTYFAKYVYDMMPLYYLHLAFTYCMVLFALVILIQKWYTTPAKYRVRYSVLLLIILVLVATNAVFLYFPGNSLFSLVDVSICGYCLAFLLIYWAGYVYSEVRIEGALSTMLLENIDQGILLFDYNEELSLVNDKALSLLAPISVKKYDRLKDFLNQCHLEDKIDRNGEHYSIQHLLQHEAGITPLRCDYRRILDKRRKTIAQLFVFTDTTMEMDILTGFQSFKDFLKFATDNPDNFQQSTTITAVDINNLTTINSSFGRTTGDEKIQELARLMSEYCPLNSYFVRGEDAILLAICERSTEEIAITAMNHVRTDTDIDFQFAVRTHYPGENIYDNIQIAVEGMRTRKLLDEASSHYQILSALLQALQESDHDTEAHVKRTQELGTALGYRLSLSDVDISNLNLLCVLHDIGKIGIPLEILNKRGRLTDEEWAVLKTHVNKGYQIALSSPHFSGVAEMILYHHERWDGHGYPKGLTGESIPLLSRVIAVVDAYDAMINDRIYRKKLDYQTACDELRKGAGTQFDPYIVSEFLQMLDAIPEYRMTETLTPDMTESSEPMHTLGAVGPIRSQLSPINVHPMQFSLYITDQEGYIISVDDAFQELTGYSAEDVKELHLRQMDLIPEEDRTDYLIQLQEQLSVSDIAYVEHRLLKKDGSLNYVYCMGEDFYDVATNKPRTKIVVVDSLKTFTMQSMTELEKSKSRERLQRWEQTYRQDSLTGLLNHAAFQRDVEMELLTDSAQIMMLMLDVDHFKNLNDTYGHSAGDEFLIFLANTLSDSLRNNDLACRMGGDEFAVALRFSANESREVMLTRAGQIFNHLNQVLGTASITTGLSMGVAIATTQTASFNQLYRRADDALYASKRQGRARMTVYEEPTE